jgi:hypothetical protein
MVKPCWISSGTIYQPEGPVCSVCFTGGTVLPQGRRSEKMKINMNYMKFQPDQIESDRQYCGRIYIDKISACEKPKE